MKDIEFRLTAKTMRRVAIGAVAAIVMIPTAVVAAGGAFTDDDTSVFESNIEWLAASGVTQGCNPPTNDQFCPEDNVTRGQMAAFMQRFAQYLDAEDGTPASADTLDGQPASDFVTPIWGAALDWQDDGQGTIDGTLGAGNNVLELEIDVPADGVVHLDYTLGMFSSNAAYYGVAWLQLNDSTCVWANRLSATSAYFDSEADVNDEFNYVSTSAVAAAPTGTHTVTLCTGLFSGGPLTRNDAAITAMFSTSGSASSQSVGGGGGSEDPQG